MTRIRGVNGEVHFRNPANAFRTLCGKDASALETSEQVDCEKCAKVYCAIKNEPWNSVQDEAMDKGIMEAVKEDSLP